MNPDEIIATIIKYIPPETDPAEFMQFVSEEAASQGVDPEYAQQAAAQAAESLPREIPSPGANPGGNYYGSPSARLGLLDEYTPPPVSPRREALAELLRMYEPDTNPPLPGEVPTKMQYERPAALSRMIEDRRVDLTNPTIMPKEEYDFIATKRMNRSNRKPPAPKGEAKSRRRPAKNPRQDSRTGPR